MCLICNHFKDGKLTADEAWHNLEEMSEGLEPEHVREIMAMIIKDEIETVFTRYQLVGFRLTTDVDFEESTRKVAADKNLILDGNPFILGNEYKSFAAIKIIK